MNKQKYVHFQMLKFVLRWRLGTAAFVLLLSAVLPLCSCCVAVFSLLLCSLCCCVLNAAVSLSCSLCCSVSHVSLLLCSLSSGKPMAGRSPVSQLCSATVLLCSQCNAEEELRAIQLITIAILGCSPTPTPSPPSSIDVDPGCLSSYPYMLPPKTRILRTVFKIFWVNVFKVYNGSWR